MEITKGHLAHILLPLGILKPKSSQTTLISKNTLRLYDLSLNIYARFPSLRNVFFMSTLNHNTPISTYKDFGMNQN